jgi:HEAT repeat protein
VNSKLNNLIEALQNPDKSARSEAIFDLDKVDDAAVLDILIQAMRTETDLLVQEDITWALVRRAEAAVPLLIDLLKDESPATRHSAAHTLGKIKDERAIDALMQAVEDENLKVVLKAAFSLSQIGNERAIPAIIKLVGHEDREVQATVLRVLDSFGAAAVPTLIVALEDEQWQVREQAADILGQIGLEIALPAIQTALQDEYWQVRFAAVNALAYIGGETAQLAIESMQNDPNSEVKELAQRFMQKRQKSKARKIG